jgi:hypothetical protein
MYLEKIIIYYDLQHSIGRPNKLFSESWERSKRRKEKYLASGSTNV